jgi:hypothetical protein
LIAAGHPDPWSYTPRQIVGFLTLASARRRHEIATQLSVHALAASGDGRAINAQFKELQRDGG